MASALLQRPLVAGLAGTVVFGHLLLRVFPDLETVLFLVPGHTVTRPFQVLTSGLMEDSFIGLVVGIAVLLGCAALLIPVWGEYEYVRFVLRKERVDTFGAIAELSALLGVPSRRFAFAGLKDYHAVTTQEIDVRGVAPAQLRRLEVHDRISVGQVRRVARKLKLGQCAGNRFRVALRGAAGGAAAVDAALAAVATNGFVNYLGLQRFGASSRNEEVGRACLQADYEAGVEAILRPQPGRKMSGAELEARAAWAVGRDAVRA